MRCRPRAQNCIFLWNFIRGEYGIVNCSVWHKLHMHIPSTWTLATCNCYTNTHTHIIGLYVVIQSYRQISNQSQFEVRLMHWHTQTRLCVHIQCVSLHDICAATTIYAPFPALHSVAYKIKCMIDEFLFTGKWTYKWIRLNQFKWVAVYVQHTYTHLRTRMHLRRGIFVHWCKRMRLCHSDACHWLQIKI